MLTATTTRFAPTGVIRAGQFAPAPAVPCRRATAIPALRALPLRLLLLLPLLRVRAQ